MPDLAPHRNLKYGFTLIELSIVLVIIGLLAGSVLVGQDLIKAAAIRAQISQIEKYNTAVRTFQGKYGGLPGDLPFTLAGQFGFYNAGMDGTAGRGDGNGLIENENGSVGFLSTSSGTQYISGEVNVFWRHLSDAGMIDGSFGKNLTSSGGYCMHNGGSQAGCLPSDQNTNQVNLWLPAGRLGKNSDLIAYSFSGNNYYQLVSFANLGNSYALGGYGGYNGSSPLTPVEAYTIDKKVDDGMPNSGKITAIEGNLVTYPLGTPSQAASHCLVFSTPVVYDTGTTNGNGLNCSMLFQFQ